MVASVTTILGAIQHHGLLSFLAHAALELPILRSIVAKEKAKMMKKLQADVQATGADAADPPFTVLPAESLSAAALRTRLLRKQGKCVLAEEGHSTVSGTVYIAGKVIESGGGVGCTCAVPCASSPFFVYNPGTPRNHE